MSSKALYEATWQQGQQVQVLQSRHQLHRSLCTHLLRVQIQRFLLPDRVKDSWVQIHQFLYIILHCPVLALPVTNQSLVLFFLDPYFLSETALGKHLLLFWASKSEQTV
ncbi:hypothetical protein HMPREF9538_02970 [Klebsiella sp. MS 92-3]|nr:hypothetical protein HMPREF9538_02970 [Klebsiella sp. MS 92-3]